MLLMQSSLHLCCCCFNPLAIVSIYQYYNISIIYQHIITQIRQTAINKRSATVSAAENARCPIGKPRPDQETARAARFRAVSECRPEIPPALERADVKSYTSQEQICQRYIRCDGWVMGYELYVIHDQMQLESQTYIKDNNRTTTICSQSTLILVRLLTCPLFCPSARCPTAPLPIFNLATVLSLLICN